MDVFSGLGGFVCSAALLCAGAASAATIDSFDTSQYIGNRLTPGQELSIAIADEALGGEREAIMNSLRVGAIESKVEAGDLRLRILRLVDSPPFMQNITSLTYDGVDNSFGWNLSNAFDLTDGGLSDRFIVEGFVEIAGLLLDPSVPLNAYMYLVASAYGGNAPQDRFNAQLEIDLPMTDLSTPAVPVHYEILFSELVPADGFDPVDLSSATAVSFTFNTVATNLALRIDTICTGNSDGCVEQVSDTDSDGVSDNDDLCPDTAQGDAVDAVGCSDAQVDGDGDGACDPGAASDGPSMCTLSPPDNCPDDSNPGQEDLDGDALGDACDDDVDGDSHRNVDDNCPTITNPDQKDFDMDGTGDACDPDDDGDGVANGADVCAATAIPEGVPTAALKNNRYALMGNRNNDNVLVFDSTNKTVFTTADTGGCSCEQIIDAQGLGGGHVLFGCSKSAIQQWIDQL